MMNKSLLYVALLLALCCSCHSKKQEEKQSLINNLPYYNEASFTPLWYEPNSNEVSKLHKIPAFRFTNQNGETITEKTFKNKIYVVNFFFTSCPGICPKMTKNMKLVQDAFKEDADVLLLSHSVTPEKDSVSVLKDYAESNGVISGKWHLVTGVQKEIYNLGRTGYFAEEDLGIYKNENEFLHTENLILIDKNRHIRGIYNGLNKRSVDQLINNIKILKKEK